MLSVKIKYLSAKFLQKFISDKLFTTLRYFFKYNKFPNLKNPNTFNEKVAFSKIYDNSQKKTMLADKFLVKDFNFGRLSIKFSNSLMLFGVPTTIIVLEPLSS